MKAGLAAAFPHSAHNWGQSILKLSDLPKRGLTLTGTYTPFNYCRTAAGDIDIGSSGPLLLDLDPTKTSTPSLLVLGSTKQGNVYLLDREHMPGNLFRRHPCSNDSATDESLLSPNPQPQFNARGPLSLFLPYSEEYGIEDQAKSHTSPAMFRSDPDSTYIFLTGSSKTGPNLTVSIPPGLARVKVVCAPGQPAYLALDQLEMTQTMQNPGSPVVTSNGSQAAIVWVLDENAPRMTPIYGPSAPQPVLYAFDALNFRLLWKSMPGILYTSGRYNEPLVVNGTVYVGTDRIEAFGLGASPDAQVMAVRHFATNPIANLSLPVHQRSVKGIDAKLIYATRCAACHDSGQPSIPTREKLSAFTNDKIVDVLTSGKMQDEATGLTAAEVHALANYLTETPARPETHGSRTNR
jgi:mono/diheme cytochrome c family protein